jgi:N-acetylglucosamine kinase-like BadF-type ATPase
MSFTTEGYNTFFTDKIHIIDSISKEIPQNINTEEVSKIYFYGASCQDNETQVMNEILHTIFPNCTQIYTEEDLLGAARGLLRNKAGFAAILGTGANTCIYDGERIVKNVNSLGYILGDEGSGASIGKRILIDYMRNRMPDSVKKIFEDTFHTNPEDIISTLYSKPSANRFCSNFARLLTTPGIDKDYRHSLLTESFTEFFKNLVACYPEYPQYKFNCIGSVAYYFKDALLEVLSDFKMEPGIIVQSIIQDLAEYHLESHKTTKLSNYKEK